VRLELWDPARVDQPDLNRQVLYDSSDLETPKVDAAAERLLSINPEATVRGVASELDGAAFFERPVPGDSRSAAAAGAAGDGAPRALVFFDCLDSFAARRGLAEVQESLLRKGAACPIFHGGVETWYGQVTTLLPAAGGYERAFGATYDTGSVAQKPIMPHVVAAVASLQVGEFSRWCETPEHTPLSDTLLLFDGREMHTRAIRLG
jgi:molybdopterin/thiamine biosynthesis adenylyltransferase